MRPFSDEFKLDMVFCLGFLIGTLAATATVCVADAVSEKDLWPKDLRWY